MVKVLVYSSKRRGVQADSLAEIGETSRRNNARDGLTGALLHDDRVFLQLIEGDHDPVARCFLRIAQSPLHDGIRIIAFADRDVRLFAAWSMQLVNVSGREPKLHTLARRLGSLAADTRLAACDELFLDQCA
jgi:hypothetical protein